jgi:hypothetical protein
LAILSLSNLLGHNFARFSQNLFKISTYDGRLSGIFKLFAASVYVFIHPRKQFLKIKKNLVRQSEILKRFLKIPQKLAKARF